MHPPKHTRTLLETIRLKYGTPQNLSWHTARLNHTRRELFGVTESLDLEQYLQQHTASLLPQSPLAKLRLIYNDEGIVSVDAAPYTPKSIRHITLIEANIDYAYKYADRTAIDHLADRVEGEALITTDGYLRDTPIANIALRQDGTWYTPATPLLPGTTRARLLHEGIVHPREIHLNTLPDYDRLAVMNAMVGFIELPMSVFTNTNPNQKSLIPNS